MKAANSDGERVSPIILRIASNTREMSDETARYLSSLFIYWILSFLI